MYSTLAQKVTEAGCDLRGAGTRLYSCRKNKNFVAGLGCGMMQGIINVQLQIAQWAEAGNCSWKTAFLTTQQILLSKRIQRYDGFSIQQGQDFAFAKKQIHLCRFEGPASRPTESLVKAKSVKRLNFADWITPENNTLSSVAKLRNPIIFSCRQSSSGPLRLLFPDKA